MPASRADNAARTGTPTAVKPALRIAISILLTVSFIWLFARRFDVRAATAGEAPDWTRLEAALRELQIALGT